MNEETKKQIINDTVEEIKNMDIDAHVKIENEEAGFANKVKPVENTYTFFDDDDDDDDYFTHAVNTYASSKSEIKHVSPIINEDSHILVDQAEEEKKLSKEKLQSEVELLWRKVTPVQEQPVIVNEENKGPIVQDLDINSIRNYMYYTPPTFNNQPVTFYGTTVGEGESSGKSTRRGSGIKLADSNKKHKGISLDIADCPEESLFKPFYNMRGASILYNLDTCTFSMNLNLDRIKHDNYLGNSIRIILALLIAKKHKLSEEIVSLTFNEVSIAVKQYGSNSLMGITKAEDDRYKRLIHRSGDAFQGQISIVDLPNLTFNELLFYQVNCTGLETTTPITLIENVTIGSDFEMFLFDENENEIINAEPYIKGDKFEPFNFDESNPYWLTSLDNVLAEGNIPPCTTMQDFNSNIEHVLEYIQKSLPPHIKIVNEPAVYMNPKYLNTPSAMEFGCTPSYNAYTLEKNPSPDGLSTNLRTGAFHVHIKI